MGDIWPMELLHLAQLATGNEGGHGLPQNLGTLGPSAHGQEWQKFKEGLL